MTNEAKFTEFIRECELSIDRRIPRKSMEWLIAHSAWMAGYQAHVRESLQVSQQTPVPAEWQSPA
jgi:hypothetical protein